MSSFRSRRAILVFIASAVAVGGLLAPETALADTALFRVEQRWYQFPAPPRELPAMSLRHIQLPPEGYSLQMGVYFERTGSSRTGHARVAAMLRRRYALLREQITLEKYALDIGTRKER
jgi:hypothetical protein